MISRRGFITGLFAPVIVPAASLMPVKLFAPDYIITGYKGKQLPDAGFYYAPYVPLERIQVTAKSQRLSEEWILEQPQDMIHVYDPSIEEMIKKVVNGYLNG